MTAYIDSSIYGLSKRVKLLHKDNYLYIVKQRKSRIIMSDSRQIMNIVVKIKEVDDSINIKLLISGPICSKSVKYLTDNKVDIETKV